MRVSSCDGRAYLTLGYHQWHLSRLHQHLLSHNSDSNLHSSLSAFFYHVSQWKDSLPTEFFDSQRLPSEYSPHPLLSTDLLTHSLLCHVKESVSYDHFRSPLLFSFIIFNIIFSPVCLSGVQLWSYRCWQLASEHLHHTYSLGKVHIFIFSTWASTLNNSRYFSLLFLHIYL